MLAAGEKAPYAVLDLLERFAPATHLPGDLSSYGALTAADRMRVLALLTAPARSEWLGRTRLPHALLQRLGRVEPLALVDLARGLREDENKLAPLLDEIPPSRRGEVYDAAYAGVVRDQSIHRYDDPYAWVRRILARRTTRWACARSVRSRCCAFISMRPGNGGAGRMCSYGAMTVVAMFQRRITGSGHHCGQSVVSALT